MVFVFSNRECTIGNSMSQTVKLVVFVPTTHADLVRQTLGDNGAGKVGDYSHCTFSVTGIGRYKPMPGAHPTIGEVGKFEEVAEDRIETVCHLDDLDRIMAAVKKVHPYEEVAFDVYPLLSDPHVETYNENIRQK